MKSSGLLLVPVITLAVACGGGGSGSGGGGGGSTTVTTAAQGTNASAASSQSLSLAANSGTSLANLAQVTTQLGGAARFRSPAADKDARHVALHATQRKAMGLQGAKLASALRKAKSLAAGQRAQASTSGSEACLDGGSYSYDVTVQDTGAFSLSLTYDACREDDEQVNGPTTATGTFSATGAQNFTITQGDGDAIIEEDQDFTAMLFAPGSDYSNLYAKYTATVVISASGSCADELCDTFNTTLTANGKEEFSNFIDEYTITYTSLSISGSDTSSATGYTSTYAANGGVSESWAGGQKGVALTFDNLALGYTVTDSYYEETADGAVKIDFTPDACFEGTFTIDTQVPVRWSYETGETYQGQVVINGNVTIVYDSDGSVTVTVTGQSADQYDSIDALESVCAIQDKKPADSTVDTVVPGDGNTTATGSTLLATLTWTGGETSDMDLHLTYYTTTAPTSSTDPYWHVYYGNPDVGDAVLDIDDTEGYGPEHITMATLPLGYYTLYVDPYSMDADELARATVTLKIGSDTFQFPAYDFYYSGPDYRVCDLRVEAGGSVTILAPDTSLYTWAPALRTPKVR